MVTSPEHARKAYCLPADFFVAGDSICHMPSRNEPCHKGWDKKYHGSGVELLLI